MRFRQLTLLTLLVLISQLVLAQYTNVSATITDPNGQPYANCTGSASWIDQNTTPGHQSLLYGSVFQKQATISGCDGFGHFTMRLADNNQISPTPSQWQFNICSAANNVGKTCFITLATVTGATQDLSATISAAAPPLPSTSVGNATTLLGKTWAIPGTIGTTTPSTAVFTTLTANATNNVQWAGPGSTPTIDQAVTACGANPCTVYISSGYTGVESSSLVTTSTGYHVDGGVLNLTVVDLRAKQVFGSPIYPAQFGGYSAGQLTRFGANMWTSGTIPDSTAGIVGNNWVQGTFPSGEVGFIGVVGTAILHDTVTVGANTPVPIGVDGEALLNATSSDAAIPFAYGVNGYCSITRTNATQNVTKCAAIHAANNANFSTSGAAIAYSYGVDSDLQTAGNTGNFSYHSSGNWLTENETQFQAFDSGGTPRIAIYWRNTNHTEFRPLSDAGGWDFVTQGSVGLFSINSTNIISREDHVFAGGLYPNVDGGTSLGKSSSHFSALYLTNATIDSSGVVTGTGYKTGSTTVIDSSSNVDAGGGSNVVYRCATAGATLPVGSLTIDATACGTTVDTGLRVK